MTTNPVLGSPVTRSPTVIVVTQQDRVPLQVLVEGRLDVGRECDGLLLADERVSRHHLRLEMVDGHMVVADLGSSNGTFVDGVRVRAPVVLGPHSTITLGSTSIRLQITGRLDDGAESGPVTLDRPPQATTLDVPPGTDSLHPTGISWTGT
jgi:pSer/pThr/pTyr-binding forkhead associated (FHA) protein